MWLKRSFQRLIREKNLEISTWPTHLDIPREFLLLILPSPKDVKESGVRPNGDGEPAIPNKHYLLSCSLPVVDLKNKYPSLWKYYQHGLDEKVNEGYLCASRKP